MVCKKCKIKMKEDFTMNYNNIGKIEKELFCPKCGITIYQKRKQVKNA